MKKQAQLSNQLKKLHYQLSYSQHINKQLSLQLSTMCQKLGIAPSKFRQTSDIALINTSTHLQQLYYVEPLIMCYEETIHLLKTQLEDAKEEAQGILANVEKVVKENSFMRKELQAKVDIITKTDNLGINVNFLDLENRDLKDKIEILNRKIEYLQKKTKQLTQQNQKSKKQNLSLYPKTTLTSIQQKSKQSQKLLQKQLLDSKSQIQVLKNKLDNEHNIVTDMDKKITQLESEVLKLKNQIRITKQQLENAGVVADRVRENLEIEVNVVKEQLRVSQQKQQQLFTKSLSLQSQIQSKSNQLQNLTLQSSQLQSNNNNMLQMLQSYQVKVSSLTKKIKKLETQGKELGDDRSEMVKRVQVAEWKLAEKTQEGERKEAQWRKERGRISKMWEERVEALRKMYEGGAQTPTQH